MHGAGIVGADVAAVVIQIGLCGDEADGAAFRARAVERALRAAEYLDAVQIEQAWLGLAFEALNGDDGHFIDIDAHGWVADGGADAADGDIVLARPVIGGKGHAGDGAGDIFIVFDMVVYQLGAADHADAARDFAGVLAALLRGDDDFLELARNLGRHGAGGVGRGGRRLCQCGRRPYGDHQCQTPAYAGTPHASLPPKSMARRCASLRVQIDQASGSHTIENVRKPMAAPPVRWSICLKSERNMGFQRF